jgi:hypothetical protein
MDAVAGDINLDQVPAPRSLRGEVRQPLDPGNRGWIDADGEHLRLGDRVGMPAGIPGGRPQMSDD